jgi:hypothetical protein
MLSRHRLAETERLKKEHAPQLDDEDFGFVIENLRDGVG